MFIFNQKSLRHEAIFPLPEAFLTKGCPSSSIKALAGAVPLTFHLPNDQISSKPFPINMSNRINRTAKIKFISQLPPQYSVHDRQYAQGPSVFPHTANQPLPCICPSPYGEYAIPATHQQPYQRFLPAFLSHP